MKWIALVALVACQHGNAGAPEIDPGYRDDIEALCDVVHRAGAESMPRDEQLPVIAMWLGPHLKTEAAHEFLVRIQPLTGEPKARALDAEAQRVGLAGCALSAMWR